MRYSWHAVDPNSLAFHKSCYAVLDRRTGIELSPCFLADDVTGEYWSCELDDSGGLVLSDGCMQTRIRNADLRVFRLGGLRTVWFWLCATLPFLMMSFIPKGPAKEVEILYFNHVLIGDWKNLEDHPSPPMGEGWSLVETYQHCYNRDRVPSGAWRTFWRGYERWERDRD